MQAAKAKEAEFERQKTFANAKNQANQLRMTVKSLNTQISKLRDYELTLTDGGAKAKAAEKMAIVREALENAKESADSASVKYAQLNSDFADGKINQKKQELDDADSKIEEFKSKKDWALKEMQDLQKKMNGANAADKAEYEAMYSKKKTEMYEFEGLATKLGKRRDEINTEYEANVGVKKEADDYMIQVEADKANENAIKKKKAYQNAEKTYNTK